MYRMSKGEQLLVSWMLILGAVLIGFIVWGIVVVVTTNELVDVLVVLSGIASGLGLVGLVYKCVGNWDERQWRNDGKFKL